VLLSLRLPVIASVFGLSALRKQVVSAPVRRHLLLQQGQSWSDDEIVWHVRNMLTRATEGNGVLMDPLLATGMVDTPNHFLLHAWYQQFKAPAKIVTVVLVETHGSRWCGLGLRKPWSLAVGMLMTRA